MLLRSKFRYHQTSYLNSGLIYPIAYNQFLHINYTGISNFPGLKQNFWLSAYHPLQKSVSLLLCLSQCMALSIQVGNLEINHDTSLSLTPNIQYTPDLCRVYLPIYPKTAYSLPFPCYCSVQASVIFWGLFTARSFQVSLLVPCLLCHRDPL